MVGYGLFVENENIGDIVVMDLANVSGKKRILLFETYLLLEVFQYLHSFPLHEIQLLQ